MQNGWGEAEPAVREDDWCICSGGNGEARTGISQKLTNVSVRHQSSPSLLWWEGVCDDLCMKMGWGAGQITLDSSLR